jgi:hypothetical protein
MLGVAALMCMSATMVVLIERKSRTAPPSVRPIELHEGRVSSSAN